MSSSSELITKYYNTGLYTPLVDHLGVSMARYDVPNPEEQRELAIFILASNIAKVPRALWDIVAAYYAAYSEGNTGLELAISLFYNETLQDWKLILPKQSVTGGSVDYNFTHCLDLVTHANTNQEELSKLGYFPLVRSHSHNTMELNSPSSVDDNAELKATQLCLIFSHYRESTNPDYMGYKLCLTSVRKASLNSDKFIRFFNQEKINNLHPYRLIDRDNLNKTNEWPDWFFIKKDLIPDYSELSEYLIEHGYIIRPPVRSKAFSNNVHPHYLPQSSMSHMSSYYYVPSSYDKEQIKRFITQVYQNNAAITTEEMVNIVLEVFENKSSELTIYGDTFQ